MKAIRISRFGGPDVLEYSDVPTPQVAPGTVLVRILAAGVNPVDTYIRQGGYPGFEPPFTPGYDGAGIIEAIGQGAARADLKVGDRVYIARPPTGLANDIFTGTYAQYALSHPIGVRPLPANVSFAQGAGVGTPYGTAWRALFQRASARPGNTVLIHGASGGVGLAAVQIARAAGLRVAGSAGTSEGMDLVRANGAHLAVNHREPGYLDQLKDFTSGKGVDIILEMAAHLNLQKDMDIVAKFGTVVVIGSRASLDFAPRGTMGKDVAIMGMSLRNCPIEQFESLHAAIAAGLESGVYRPIVSLELPLADAAKAHIRVTEPSVHGKIVLTP
jgi:NADPH:quinone reductase